MQITLVQGLLIALLVFICAIDKHMETFMWFRPLVVAFFTGIILGDVRLGMQAGAVAELSYLGLLTVGGTVPPDPLFAGLMTTVLAYTTGCDVNTALGLAVPFALIGQWINTGTKSEGQAVLGRQDSLTTPWLTTTEISTIERTTTETTTEVTTEKSTLTVGSYSSTDKSKSKVHNLQLIILITVLATILISFVIIIISGMKKK